MTDSGALSAVLVLASENPDVKQACASLTTVGVSAVRVSSLSDALTVVQRTEPDLVAVEVGESYPDGIEAISRLRFMTSLPIIAIALPDDGAVVARALEGGADGYLTAFPLLPEDLRDRLTALRRGVVGRGPATVSLAQVRDLAVDFDRCEATLAGHQLSLTPTEFRLIASLVRAAGRVVSARQLLDEAQGGLLPDSEAREIVKVHMRRLRGKLQPYQGANPYIMSVRGFGYLLERRSTPRAGDFLTAYIEEDQPDP